MNRINNNWMALNGWICGISPKQTHGCGAGARIITTNPTIYQELSDDFTPGTPSDPA